MKLNKEMTENNNNNIKDDYIGYLQKFVAFEVLYLKANAKKEFEKMKGKMSNLNDNEVLMGKVMTIPSSKKKVRFTIGLNKGKRLLEGVTLSMLKKGIQNYERKIYDEKYQ